MFPDDNSWIEEGMRYFESVQIVYRWAAQAVAKLSNVHFVVRDSGSEYCCWEMFITTSYIHHRTLHT